MFFWVLIIVAIVLLAQLIAQFLCARRDAQRFPAPGSLVKTARGAMHVQAMGRGNPAIVLEAGIAASSLNWSILQPQLAELTSTYSYDRAGYGWSPVLRNARECACTLQNLSSDLHALIVALKLPQPYVLMGHSFGAYIVRAYAQRFPDELAGVILVDPLTPEEWLAPSRHQLGQISRGVWFSRAGAVLGSLGVVRFCLWLLNRGSSAAPRGILSAFGSKASETGRRIVGELSKLPPPTMRRIRERWSNGRFFWTMARYIRSIPACAVEAAKCEILPHIPVTVISGAHQPPVRMQEHQAIAARSLHGKHIVAKSSAHWIHLDQPELIVQAYREMVETKKLEPQNS